MRIGTPIRVNGLVPGRAGARVVTERIEVQLGELLAGVQESQPPGRFGRWLSEAFNDRPWLTPEGLDAGPGERSSTATDRQIEREADAPSPTGRPHPPEPIRTPDRHFALVGEPSTYPQRLRIIRKLTLDEALPSRY